MKNLIKVLAPIVFVVTSCVNNIPTTNYNDSNNEVDIVNVQDEQEEVPKVDMVKIMKLIKSHDNRSGFKTMALNGKTIIQGKTSIGGVVSNSFLYANGFEDNKGYELNSNSNKDTWAIKIKRKNKGQVIVDNPEKLPLRKKFIYLNSSFNFDEMFVFFFSKESSDFNASIKEYTPQGEFFGKALDNVRCCYNNRDLGAAGIGAGNEHLGQDLVASPGNKVYAIADGTVKRVKAPSDGYGAVIIIEHELPDDTKVVSIYGHLSRKRGFNVKAGQKVKKGDLIAYIGDDNENGDGLPHLHLGIKLGVWDTSYPGYCGTGENRIFSGSDYSGNCSSSGGKFVRPLTFMESVNRTSKNPYAEQSR
jgi:murein DD-endopeptidase MepM/ murein hydrolase activator NlpD